MQEGWYRGCTPLGQEIIGRVYRDEPSQQLFFRAAESELRASHGIREGKGLRIADAVAAGWSFTPCASAP